MGLFDLCWVRLVVCILVVVLVWGGVHELLYLSHPQEAFLDESIRMSVLILEG